MVQEENYYSLLHGSAVWIAFFSHNNVGTALNKITI